MDRWSDANEWMNEWMNDVQTDRINVHNVSTRWQNEAIKSLRRADVFVVYYQLIISHTEPTVINAIMPLLS